MNQNKTKPLFAMIALLYLSSTWCYHTAIVLPEGRISLLAQGKNLVERDSEVGKVNRNLDQRGQKQSESSRGSKIILLAESQGWEQVTNFIENNPDYSPRETQVQILIDSIFECDNKHSNSLSEKYKTLDKTEDKKMLGKYIYFQFAKDPRDIFDRLENVIYKLIGVLQDSYQRRTFEYYTQITNLDCIRKKWNEKRTVERQEMLGRRRLFRRMEGVLSRQRQKTQLQEDEDHQRLQQKRRLDGVIGQISSEHLPKDEFQQQQQQQQQQGEGFIHFGNGQGDPDAQNRVQQILQKISSQ